MARFKTPSQAVLEARAGRAKGDAARNVRIEWFVKNVSDKVEMTLKSRVMLATEYLRNKVVRNISRPVTVGKGPRGGRVVTDRSESGEFPKADTTQLMKTIVMGMKETAPGVWEGQVGTPLDYGVILEVSERLNRSFLMRTLREEQPMITRMLTGPMKQ